MQLEGNFGTKKKKRHGVYIKLSMKCSKKIVKMCKIYYGMLRERIKGREEGVLEGTSGAGEEGKGAQSH